MSKSNFNLLFLIELIKKNKGFIIILVIITMIAGVVFSKLSPAEYSSKASFIVKSPMIFDRNQIFDEAAKQNKNYFAVEDEIDHIVSISNSEQFFNSIIDSFNLKEHYKVKDKKEAVRIFKKNKFKFKRSSTRNIEIEIIDNDPEIAYVLLQGTVELLESSFNNYFTQINQDIVKALDNKILSLDTAIGIINDSANILVQRYQLNPQILLDMNAPIQGVNTVEKAQVAEKVLADMQSRNQMLKDKTRYSSLKNEFSIGLNEDGLKRFYFIQKPFVNDNPVNMSLSVVLAICFVVSMLFAISYLVIVAAIRGGNK